MEEIRKGREGNEMIKRERERRKKGKVWND